MVRVTDTVRNRDKLHIWLWRTLAMVALGWLVAMADQVVANFGLVSPWTSDQLRNLSKFNRRSVS